MAQRRILCILESRATYGYARNVMLAMLEIPALECLCVVSGMHLLEEFGNSGALITADGFEIAATVQLQHDGDGAASWARGLGRGIASYADVFEKLSPDIVLLFGDRIETFGACVAAGYMGIPMAHVQAGDKSGHIDDAARMAMAKFVHIHFASCEDSASRLRRMGEQEFRIFNVGAPQLDDVVGRDFRASEIIIDGELFDLSERYLVLLQHPVMAERADVRQQIESSVRASANANMPVFWIYPNADMGHAPIINTADNSTHHNFRIIKTMERTAFLTLLANAAVLVGNSSAGILEAPSFKVPVVNIGQRQRGRLQASNILNCSYEENDIGKAIETALSSDFKKECEQAVNPYGDGKSGSRIARRLSEILLDITLLDKETVY